MDPEKLRTDVINSLRSCVISFKGKCDVRQIRADYRSLMGTDIPYSQLGYRNLEEFIKSIPSIVVFNTPNGIFLEAKKDDKTSHIANLVNSQKGSKKKKSFAPPPRRYQNHYQPRIPNKSVVPNWKPKVLNQNVRQFQPVTPRKTVTTHNQFVSHPKSNLPPRFAKQREERKVEVHEKENINITVNNSSEKGDSVLAAAKKRIVQRMSDPNIMGFCEQPNTEHVFDLRDKLNSNHAMHNLNGHKPEFAQPKPVERPMFVAKEQTINQEKESHPLTGNFVQDLYDFANRHKLEEPIFKIMKRKSKPRKATQYDCQVKIGDQSFSSYPNDFIDETMAKQFAAKLALDALVPKYKRPRSLLLSNEQDILERIPPLVQKHYHGIWNWQIEADYKDIFQEELPVNWMEIVDVSPSISVVPCLDKFVLRYCNPGDKNSNKTFPMVSLVSVPSSSVNFDEEGTLFADVTCVVSANEVWCRQIDSPEAEEFDIMSTKMNDFYKNSKNIKPPKSINVGDFYVAMYDTNEWVRVRILDKKDDSFCNCFFIDFGNEYLIHNTHIFELEREFAKEKAQAFLCSLVGLEALEEASVNSGSLQKLVGQRVQILSSPNTDEEIDPANPAISVIMYDLATGEVINEKLITAITIELATPVLSKDAPTEVYVSYVAENGDIYVQVHSSGFEKLLNLLQDFECDLKEEKVPEKARIVPKPTNTSGKLFMCLYKKNNTWQRVKIIDWAPNSLFAQVYFVDIGDTDVVSVCKDVLYNIEDINDILYGFPEQAVKVRMAMESVVDFGKIVDFPKKIREYMPNDKAVLLKIVQQNEITGIAEVEFFTRSETNNLLFPVNKALKLNENGTESVQKKEKVEKLKSFNHFEHQNKNFPSGGSLKCPILPEIGQYFDVKVPCAVNPWNFFVQPYASQEQLNKLMLDLQTRYGDLYFSSLSIEDIEPGKIYASKHCDGVWYRITVIKVIHSGCISVFYCDFGYYGSLTLDKIVPLHSEFLDLPYQAIKAKLAGIKPKYDKWTIEDCKYFEDLVCRKNFVSIVESIDKDETYRCDNVVSLTLIDTSTDEDVYIDKDLIARGIAVESDQGY